MYNYKMLLQSYRSLLLLYRYLQLLLPNEGAHNGLQPREVLTMDLSFSRGGLLFQKEEMHQYL